MHDIPDTSNPLSTTQSTCLIASPLLLIIARLLIVPFGQDNATYLAEVKAHAFSSQLGAAIGIVGTLLLIPAFLGLGTIAGQRIPRLGAVGSGLAITGMIGLVMVYVLHGVASAISQQLSGATAVRMWDHVFNNNANSVIAQAFLVTGVVGILCLAVGLFRSHAVPHTAAVLTGLGAALLMVTAAGPVKPLIVGAAALAFIGFGWVAIAASGGRASVRHRQGTESNRAG